MTGYSLGRRSVPVDVCRPRQPIATPIHVESPKVLVHPDAPSQVEAVPQRIGRASDTTQRLTTAVGPGHAQLQSLAETGCGSLILAGRYHLDRRIGRGGMATVFGGEQLALGRHVAVKVLDDGRGFKHASLQRFLSEGRTMARINHPNIVEVFDLGSTAEGVVYMVMELLEGEDLQKLLAREGRLPWALARELMLDILAGLEAIHAAGVVHRDLKPANCYRTRDGVKLLDFGIAAAGCDPLADAERDARRLTLEGQVIGTPEYMSPEQARGGTVDAPSDVYSAGILLGELLTGRVPFDGKTATAIIDAQIHEPAPSLRELAGGEVEIAAELEAIYARALSKDPSQRFASAAELRAAIEAVGANTAPRSRWVQAWRSVAALGLTWLASHP